MFGTQRTAGILTKVTVGFAAAILLLALVTNKFFIGGEEDIKRPVTEGVEVPATVPQQPQNMQQPAPPQPQPQQQPQQQAPPQGE
jgi:hypothetical protein